MLSSAATTIAAGLGRCEHVRGQPERDERRWHAELRGGDEPGGSRLAHDPGGQQVDERR